MTETASDIQAAAPAESTFETLHDVLASFTGKIVTMVNPESLEDAPVGRRLTTGIYRAKVLQVAADHIVVATEYKHRKPETGREPVKQFLPLARVKRISLMKGERLIHL